MKKAAFHCAAVVFSLSTYPAISGGFGNTAIKDDQVANTAQTGRTIFCRRLDQEIPERLFEQMDCSGPARSARRGGLAGLINQIIGQPGDNEGFARPRVLSDGIGDNGSDRSDSSSDRGSSNSDSDGGNSGGAGGSSSGDGGASDTGGSNQQDDPGGTTGGSTSDDPTTGGSNGDTTSEGSDNDTTSGGATFTEKWDRLSDFGVTRDNYKDQDKAFKDQAREHRRAVGQDGDWSGFTPTENP